MFVVLTGILLTGVQLLTPIFSRLFMDHILSRHNPQWLIPLLAAMALTLAFQFVVNVIQGIHWLKIEGKLAVEANASFMWHVLRLPVSFFAQRYIGDIASRQTSNEQIAATLIGQLAPIFLNLVLLLAYLAIMIQYSPVLAVVGVTTSILYLVSMRLVSKRRLDLSRVTLRDGGRLMGATMSGFEIIETIKASGAEGSFFQRWAGYFASYSNALVQFNQANQFYSLIPPLLQQGSNIIILVMGVYLILDGSFTIGMLLAFQGFTASFLSPVQQLVGASQSFIEMRSQMERVEDVFNYQPDVEEEDPSLTLPLERLRGGVELRGNTFGYNKTAPPLIEDFSLTVKPGGSIALVGSSGSGKSTVGKLIAGLYKPWSGQILFDGIPREQVPRQVLTASIAVVDQDIALFEDTIFNNLTLWDKSIDEATVIEACKDAQIHEDIMGRPGGYAHVIKEGGKNFSGGQRQRLEIARALAQRPTILILDEATSALDTKTEHLIMEAVKAKGISLIIIAHRLSTIRDCDEIIVLDQGQVVERGTHEELLKLGGKYSALVST
ncbi:ABC transporter transmembrane domain-containing protein [Candidatus Darwinibacter acetoxidans]